MGVDFYLHRIKQKGIPKSQVELPEIEARFAATEYPRFLRQLAHDAGLGDLWDAYNRTLSEWHDRRVAFIAANLDPPLHLRQIRDKQQRRRLRKEHKKKPPASFDADPENRRVQRAVEAAQKAIVALADDEPLVGFLLPPAGDVGLNSEACGRIAPRMRAIAQEWEPAPQGRVGWRERACELADAMELAGRHPNVALFIDG